MKKNCKKVAIVIIFSLLLIGGIVFFVFQKGKAKKISKITLMMKPNPSICEKPDGIDNCIL